MNFLGTSNLQRKSNKTMYIKVCQVVKCYKKGVLPYGQPTLPFLDRISELTKNDYDKFTTVLLQREIIILINLLNIYLINKIILIIILILNLKILNIFNN